MYYHGKGSCTGKKADYITLELSQRRRGVKAQSKIKGALFATNRFPPAFLSSYLTSMVVLHFSYLIKSTLEPSLCVG